MYSEVFKILVHNPFDWRKPMSYISWAIRKVTGAFYNHEAICIKLENTYYVIQAVLPRVTITEYNQWATQTQRQIFFIDVPADKYDLAKVKQTALEQIGIRYDIMSLIFYLPLYIITKRWIGRKGQRAHRRLYCYELVSFILGDPNSYDVIPTT